MAEVLTVLLSVSNKLSTFLISEVGGELLGGLRQDVQLISDEFDRVIALLEATEFKEEVSPLFRDWIIRLMREAAYDTEDFLDEYMFLFDPHRPNGFHDYVRWSFNSIKNFPVRLRLSTKLQSIKSRIKDISEARLRYESRYGKIPAQAPLRLAVNNATFAEETQLVGIDEPKQKLISQLLESDSKLKVIAVVGMEGIGKTTLVKNVHDDAQVKNRFQIRAWVNVYQIYDSMQILTILNRQLDPNFRNPTESMSIDELKAIVNRNLQHGRYAIVFDNVRGTIFWDRFKSIFPQNIFGGNRVMLTTQFADVASASCMEPHGLVHRMELLSFEESWTLFCRKTFKDNSCPPHLKTVAECIVGKCEGLPMAIALISGVLGSKNMSRIGEWEKVLRRLQDEFEGTCRLDMRTKKMLRLCYDDLPFVLKTCLQYTGIYAEDFKIGCPRLIQLWIAERFVEGSEELTASEVGMAYIKELSNRSLIQVSEEAYGGLPSYFRFHDLVREFIVWESNEQNMMAIAKHSDKKWPPKKLVRRIIFHNDFFDDDTTQVRHQYLNNNLRSILTFASIKPPSKAFSLTKILTIKLLKVVNFEGLILEEIPKQIFNLFLLNYLNLSRTRVKIVPESIGRLQNLEHLDLSETYVTELPTEIIKLHKLRHLSVSSIEGSGGFKVPCEMGGLVELETLEDIDAAESDSTRLVNEVGKLTQLRRLTISSLRKEDGKELCSSLENLINLRELGVASSSVDVILDLNHSLSAMSLQYVFLLSLMGRLEKMPQWIRNLHRLETLNLIYSSLMDDPLESLQHFPNLTELHLCQAYQGESLCFRGAGAGGFPKLKKLTLRKMNELRWVRVEEGAMPSIKQLFLQQLPLLEEVPLGIEHLSHLQELRLTALNSELTKKLLDNEVFKETEDYEKIAHIPQVVIVFERDGAWWKQQLSQEEKTPS